MQIAHSNLTPPPNKLTSRFAKKMAYKAYLRTLEKYADRFEAVYKATGERPVFNQED